MKMISRARIGCVAIAIALASSASAEGLPDILGIQLGMPVREAYAKLQAQIPKNKIQVMSTATTLPRLDKPVITSLLSAPAEQIMMGMEADQVTVDVTLPPNKQSVWRIRREHFFRDKGIAKTTLLSSLREKYGKESRATFQGGKATTDENQIMSLLWLMDEQGRPATLPPLAGMVDPLTSCKATAEGEGAMVVESPPPTTFSGSDYKWCLSSYIAVAVQLSQNASVPELCERMIVYAVSLPLGSRAGEATMKWKEDLAAGQHKQDIEKAKQQEKPKL